MAEQLALVFGGAPAGAPEPSDAGQRRRALDAASSFIVQAPAGSGKTELLIQRYLGLLAAAADPESIVAITFTVKAAAEMRDRVLKALAAGPGAEPEREHEKLTWSLARRALEQDARRGWSIVSNPSRMRILTIDALCMSITRQMPWMARFGAMPEVTEDARLFYDEAAARTIRLIGGGDELANAIQTVIRHRDYQAAATVPLLAQMLAVRDHWLPIIGYSPDTRRLSEARARLEEGLARIARKGIDDLHASLPAAEADELIALARYAADQLDDDHEASGCRELRELPRDPAGWRAIAALVLTGNDAIRKRVDKTVGFAPKDRNKDRFLRLLSSLSANPDFTSAISNFRKLPDPAYSDTQWEVLSALFRVLPRAAAELRVIFSERGVVDFAEISMAALSALGTPAAPTDLALTLGHRIEHLLIDEFQDTSKTQDRLLRALTAGWGPGDLRTLFLVGDPMQSIYRFRQAEVGLFLRIREQGMPGIALEPLTLSANFRSAPKVVEWVNTTFSRIFPAEPDPEHGASPYEASEAQREARNGAGVFVHPIIGRDDRAETEVVVRLIEAAAEGESVAVLVRARTHLLEVANCLRERGIRFRAIEIDSLAERPVVQDLLALTRALTHLADRVSWLAVLRAPWCGLTLAELARFAGDAGQTVWQQIAAASAEHPDTAARIARFQAVIGPALARRGRMSLRSLVEGVWASLGGPACQGGDADLADARAFLDLLEAEEQGGDLLHPRSFKRKVDDLFAAPDPAAPPTLELMTIHKAKGLEFDTVIVPGIGRPAKQDDPQLLLWSERLDGEILLAPMSPRRGDRDPISRHLETEERVKQRLESARLLYVACTRAKSQLHLAGHAEVKQSGLRPESGSFLELLWSAVGGEFLAAPVPTNAPPAATRYPRLRRLPALLAAPPFAVDSSPAPTPVMDEKREAGTEAATGIAMHLFLAQIAAEGPALWDENRVRSARSRIEYVLAANGTPAGERSAEAGRVIDGLLRTLGDPRGRWILARHAEAASEYEVSTAIEGEVVDLRIDRTFVDDSGGRWIIDYKTGSEEAAGSYWPQLERYARVLAEFDRRPIRLGLYFPMTSKWVSRDHRGASSDPPVSEG